MAATIESPCAPDEPWSSSAAGRPQSPFTSFDLVLIGIWFGIATGLFEYGCHLATVHGLGVITYDTLRTNRHHVWMTPASNLLVFLGPTIVFAALSIPLARLREGRLAFWLLATATTWSALSIPGLHSSARVLLAAGLASAATRLFMSRRAGFRSVVRATTPIGLAAVAAMAIASETVPGRAAARPPATPGAPNVLLIVLDTVRADSTTPYGSLRDTTPNLAALARRGVVFRNARATASWTLPSHASLFTGRWPFELSVDVGRPLDDEHPTVAEELARRGYATGGFVANTENCNAWYGLSRGFDHYEDFYENDWVTPLEVLRSSRLGRLAATSKWSSPLVRAAFGRWDYRYRKSAAMINRDALAWLDGQGERPFFLFLNYFDAHDPYIPPADAVRRFSAGAGGPGSGAAAARNSYDDCLAYLDGQLGAILDELERRGRLDDTLIVVASDHGESFGEHGLDGHGVSLYRAETQIPLVVVAPGRVPQGRAVDRPASLRDVAATLLGIVDGRGVSTFPGASLVSAWLPEPSGDDSTPVLTELDRAEAVPKDVEEAPARLGRMRSLVTGRHAYILNGDGSEELYDLLADPDEHRNLASLPEAQDRLRLFRDQMHPLTGMD